MFLYGREMNFNVSDLFGICLSSDWKIWRGQRFVFSWQAIFSLPSVVRRRLRSS